MLHEEQKIAFLAGMEGKNILITGGGGVGKSHLIKIMEKHIKDIVLTATTGIAAINIGGQTLDRFMGFGSHSMTPTQAMKMRDDVRERLSLVKVILIDEASMLRIDKFECLNARLQSAKKNSLPFGGVQIILVGDFCQLKPIVGSKSDEVETFRQYYDNSLYCFESFSYDEAQVTPYVLTEYVRQGDEKQRQALRNIRMGANIQKSVDLINYMAKGEVSKDALYLVTTNKHADNINEKRYNEIKTKKKTFYGSKKKDFTAFPVPEAINLKIGCRVMIAANNADEDYYNGDIGTIESFGQNLVKVKLDRGITVEVVPFKWEQYSYKVKEESLEKSSVGEFEQIPLKLAYAVTIHKSQGLTLDEAIVDFSGGGVARSGTFTEGQAYVALSRVRSFENLLLVKPLTVSDIKTERRACAFTKDVSMSALARRADDLKHFQL